MVWWQPVPIPLTHRCVLVDQQVGIKEVVDEVGQAIALTWEENKNKELLPWHGPARLGKARECSQGIGLMLAKG